MSIERDVFEAIRDIPRIIELDFTPIQVYSAGSIEEVLYPLIESHDIIEATGAFFGDEGKGKTIDAIAWHPLIAAIFRTNSGQNAGHTVFDKKTGKKFAFHGLPSGIFTGKPCLIGENCAYDIIRLMKDEIGSLINEGIPYGNVYIGNIHLTMPYHVLLDFLRNPTNSSTLQGISPIHASKVMKRGLRLNHLFGPIDVQRKRLKDDMEIYNAIMQYRGWSTQSVLERCIEENKDQKRFADHIIGFLQADDPIEYIIDLHRRTVVENSRFPKRADTKKMFSDIIASGKKGLVEPAQGFYLSNSNDEHWDSSTSADTTADGTLTSGGINQRKYRVAVINVHKVPSSRVGRGENPIGYVKQEYFSSRGIKTLDMLSGKCESVDEIVRQYFDSVRENGLLEPTSYTDKDGSQYLIGEAMAIALSKRFDECGATTKKPRILGEFDCVKHYHVNEVQGPYLSISAVDRFDGFEKVGLVVAYAYHDLEGKEIDDDGHIYRNGMMIRPGDRIPCEDVQRYCHKIIKVIDAWPDEPISSKIRKKDDPLPKGLQEFVGNVEYFTGAEVISVGNGTGGDDLIYIRRHTE